MKKSNNTLIAGPWWGEFGHELFAWQAYVRALSRHYDRTHIICRENSAYLYKDFADDYTFISTPGGIPDGFLIRNFDMNNCIYNLVTGDLKDVFRGDSSFLPPRPIDDPDKIDCKKSIEFGHQHLTPEYQSYGSKMSTNIEYVFHIRQRELNQDNNWSIKNWEKLLSYLSCDKEKIACIGTTKDAGHIAGTIDYRDRNLNDTCNVLKNAKCVFGPSSGPIHLATLCECKQVVWGVPKAEKRYVESWNPFGCKVLFMKEHTWQPSPEYVFEKFNNFIKV